MTRRYGRSPRGRRLILPVPQGHRKATTFLAGLRLCGLTAPSAVDGAIDGEVFGAYVRRHPVPTLRAGDVVVMDDPAPHERAGVKEAIASAGATVLYPPPYSPDLNPIERASAGLKALLRRAGERAVEALWRLLGQLLDAFSPEECRNSFAHRGYIATPT